jgi:hypothetical protein
VAYDERLASRVRAVIAVRDAREAFMFGGLAFFVGGNLGCGILGHEVIVRLGRAVAEGRSWSIPTSGPCMRADAAAVPPKVDG